MRLKHSFLVLFCLSLLMPCVSAAQEDTQAADRVDRLERDIQLLQRQLARSGRSAPIGNPPVASAEMIDPTSPAQVEVRLTAMEDELRAMRGKVEENEFQVRKISETLDKLKQDTEFRFSELGQSPTAAVPQPHVGTEPAKETAANTPAGDGKTTAGDGVLRPEEGTKTDGEFATPRDLYNYAFRLLNQTKYEEAASSFASFTKKYPKDPLVGNAYYWAGETYYIRRDYVNAADHFRQGFEALPDGPKAADNLLKLAMSLDALNRDEEACVVLGQITTKYKKSSTSIVDKAGKEIKRIGCK